MKISIITPSYRQLRWLKLCLASVADQKGVSFEHIIQDAQTGKELVDWVKAHSDARLFVESDTGMYDAINRGFLKVTGDIVAWLNCDEQYLPGALAKVAAFFEKHPEVDVLFGDAVLLSEKGDLLSYRRMISPSLLHIQISHLNTLSCSTFVRRSVIDRGLFLNSEWKTIADAVWVADLIKAKLRMAVLHEPLAAFTMTEENLGQSSLSFQEGERWKKQISPPWKRMMIGPVVLWHRIRKFFQGAYELRRFTTEIYTESSVSVRTSITARKLSFAWKRSQKEGGSKRWRNRIFESFVDVFKTGKLNKNGATKALPFSYYQPRRWPLIYILLLPVLFAVVVLYFEQETPDIIVAPMLSTTFLLLLSFYLEPLYLLPFVVAFIGVIYCSLRFMQPFDVERATDWIRLSLRLTGFCFASALAVLFSKYRCKAKIQQDQMVEIIISMPIPVVISDAIGMVIFANDEMADFMGVPREQIEGMSYLRLFMAHMDEGTVMRDYIKFFQTAPETNEDSIAQNQGLRLTMADGMSREVAARFICLGQGKARHMVTVLKL